MTVSIVFEVRTTPDEPLHAMLSEIDTLPHWERQLMIGRVMRFRADQIVEEAAGALAVQAAEDRRQARIRATRERNKTSSPTPEDPRHS
jgi:hypothetical protein